MQANVLLFGPYADAVGARSVAVAVTPHATVADILASLESVPALAPLMRGARLAVNASYVPREARVAVTDELALIGLVGGG
ncbi:MAG: MoaD/ThiS family protein [Phycisphaerae bacterium]|nr:MoaD/ThiS family protein [Phycisphaerae bacterium]